MSSDYTFKFTDPNMAVLFVPAYYVDGPSTPLDDTALDHVSNQISYPPTLESPSTTLVLVGKGVADYGEQIQQNLIYMLENFANNTPPVKPIIGQLWYNKTTNTLNIFNNNLEWNSIIDAAGGVVTGPLSVLSSPVSNNDVATKLYVDDLVTAAIPVQNPVTRLLATSSGQYIFTAPEYTIGDNKLWVFANGLKQVIDEDYEETSTSSITFIDEVPLGTKIEIIYLP